MIWTPDDAELDAVARTVDLPSPSQDQIEQLRTSVLARAASTPQRRRRSSVPLVATLSAAFAVAAGMLLWLAVRPSEAMPKEIIVPFGIATFHREAAWPDYAVRVAEGHVSIAVAPLSPDERFRARTSDAELETREGTFVIGVHADRLQSVAVTRGTVELRRAPGPVIVLAAGQVWPPVHVAETIELAPSPPAPTPAPPIEDAPLIAKSAPSGSRTIEVPQIAKPGRPGERGRPGIVTREPDARETRTQVASKSVAAVASDSHAAAAPAERARSEQLQRLESSTLAPAKPAGTSPGELAFRDGVVALRRGDARGATKLFETACTALQGEAIDEDACFWVGAAAKRAGQLPLAKTALASFLQQFPTSSRVGEASALLGWILYEAGDLAAAEPHFERAAGDRVPRVRESAERGIEAIKRRRTSP